MKLNKYILPIALAVSALSFCSCNDFLDRHPQDSLPKTIIPEHLPKERSSTFTP